MFVREKWVVYSVITIKFSIKVKIGHIKSQSYDKGVIYMKIEKKKTVHNYLFHPWNYVKQFTPGIYHIKLVQNLLAYYRLRIIAIHFLPYLSE